MDGKLCENGIVMNPEECSVAYNKHVFDQKKRNMMFTAKTIAARLQMAAILAKWGTMLPEFATPTNDRIRRRFMLSTTLLD